MKWRWSRSIAVAAMVIVTAVGIGRASDPVEGAQAAWIGVTLQSGTGADGDARGVRIESIEDDGPAARAGLRVGDLVTQVDGRAVRHSADFIRAIRAERAGKRFRLTVVRDNRTRSLEVKSTGAPSEPTPTTETDDSDAPIHWLQASDRPRLGLEVIALDADLAPYFETTAGAGVLVTRVLPGSGAAQAGIKSGDVLRRVENQDVGAIDDLHAILQERAAGDRVEVEVLRHGRNETFQVEVGEADFARLLVQPRRPWTGRLRSFGPESSDLEALRRDLRSLQRDLDELKRDLRDRR